MITQREARRYERVLEKHDRKGELRASVLGIDSPEFREKERHHSLANIVKNYGFDNEQAFYRALIGKIREELHKRGWSFRRIEAYEMSRLARLT
jgi:uroporphyrinogen-III synthase